MTNTATVTISVPSWASIEPSESENNSFSVSLVGATENIDGGTYIKKNNKPENDKDYDAMCDSYGNLSGECQLTDVTSIYIWGYGCTLNGVYIDCESEFEDAMEVEISEHTSIILWGVNSNP